MRHGGQILADQLAIEGVKRAFCVPGESFLAALDGMVDGAPEMIACRQEGGAAMMAEATGKLAGLGVSFATRAPGATNAAAGVHVARHDGTPMLLFLGQVGRAFRDRDAFQEVDLDALFAPLAKWTATIDEVARIPEYVSRAVHVARSGRPGPVVLSLPEDMLSGAADCADMPRSNPAVAKASAEDVSRLLDAIAGSRRPLLVVGGPGWSAEAAAALGRVARRLALPVAATFRRQDHLDNRHPHYAGELGIGANPKLVERFRASDLVILLGTRLSEMASQGYALLGFPDPGQAIAHVLPAADEIGRHHRPGIAIVSAPLPFLEAIEAALDRDGVTPAPDRPGWVEGARADYEAWQQPVATPGRLRMETVVRHLGEVLPDDAVLSNGAGNYTAWAHRYFPYRRWGTQLAPTSGSMGYGLPAAIAAKLHDPRREAVALAGDGCFLMTGQELATAVQHGAGVVTLVCDNGMYGTIRMHQERHYPGRVVATGLRNPDFAAYATSFGAMGATVDADAEFADALADARREAATGRPALLHCKLDPEALTPRRTLSEMRAEGERLREAGRS